MAIGPAAASTAANAPVPTGPAGRLARALQDAFGFRGREDATGSAPRLAAVPTAGRSAAEADHRQLNLEEAAEHIRRLNPNAPRGSLVNLVV